MRRFGEPIARFGEPLGKARSGGGGVAAPDSISGLVFWQETRFLPSADDNDPVTSWQEETGKADTTAPGAAGTHPLYKLSIFGDKPAIRFDGSNDYMETAPFTQAQPFTIVMLVKPRAAKSIRRLIDGNTVNQVVINQQWNIYAGANFVATNQGVPAGSTAIVFAEFDGVNSRLTINRHEVVAAATPGTNGITDGLTIGGAGNQGASFFINMDIGALMVYAGLLTSESKDVLRNYFAYHYDALTTAYHIVFDGDSLTAGQGSTPGNNYPARCLSLLGGQFSGTNVAESGQTMENMNSDAATQIDAALYFPAAHAQSFVVAWGGTNDIIFGADATTTYNRIVTYCQNRRAAGWKVVVCDIIARGNFDATMNTHRDTVNSNIAANWATFADAYVPLSAQSVFDDPNDTVYYDVDTIHLNDAGYAIVADLVHSAIIALTA